MGKNKKLQSSEINWGQAIVEALREETKEQKKIRIRKVKEENPD